MGIFCSKFFRQKKRVFLDHCSVCTTLCNRLDFVHHGDNKLCTLCNIEYRRGRLQGSDVFI